MVPILLSIPKTFWATMRGQFLVENWKLSELRQQGPMEEYTDQFMEQLAKTNNLNQTQQTMLYMAGAELSELLHIETELINLRT